MNIQGGNNSSMGGGGSIIMQQPGAEVPLMKGGIT